MGLGAVLAFQDTVSMGRKAFCGWAASLNQCLPSTRQITGNVETGGRLVGFQSQLVFNCPQQLTGWGEGLPLPNQSKNNK